MLSSLLSTGAPFAMRTDFVGSIEDFALIWAAVIAGVTVLFVGVGLFFEVLNARHPENRVQKGRVNKRKWAELAQAPISIATLSFWFSIGLFVQWRGWAMAPLPLSWWSVPLMLGATIVLYDAWFYWIHRFMHWKPIYRFHALHHKSIAPTAWSNNHDSFVDSTLCQLYFALLPFVIPIPWQVMVLHKIYDQVSGMVGHAGFEHFASPANRAPWPLASTVFHDQHHSGFRYNYAHTFSFWDRLMGTLHPAYDETLKTFEPGSPAAIAKGPDTIKPA